MQFVDNQTFNGLISAHVAPTIFLFVIPAFAGLGNYVIPLMIGAPDMAFPRLTLSYWLLPIAGFMMLLSLSSWWCVRDRVDEPRALAGSPAPGAGVLQHGRPVGGASSIMTALNFLVTIITMRAPGMTFWRMPLLVAELHHIAAGRDRDPAVDRGLAVLHHVRPRDAHPLLYPARRGIRARLPAHLLVRVDPAVVHIMMLPGFGIALEVISVMARKPIFGYRLMVRR